MSMMGEGSSAKPMQTGGAGYPAVLVPRTISQARPSGRQSSRTSPFSDTNILSMTCIPKPRRVDSETAGPPNSEQ